MGSKSTPTLARVCTHPRGVTRGGIALPPCKINSTLQGFDWLYIFPGYIPTNRKRDRWHLTRASRCVVPRLQKAFRRVLVDFLYAPASYLGDSSHSCGAAVVRHAVTRARFREITLFSYVDKNNLSYCMKCTSPLARNDRT
jgi:vesicle coat complex subunit